MEPLELETPQGVARVHVHPGEGEQPFGSLVLGHGAGGGVGAPDLVAATQVATALDYTVALVEQPYRVAGRRSPPAATALDSAWRAILEQLQLPAGPLIVGGRSSGARVACRTAHAVGANGVLCLAFPLHPPGRPEKTRLAELEQVTVPVLIVQGSSDPFGMPPSTPQREVAAIKGNHSLRSDKGALQAAVEAWLSDR